MNLFSLSEWLNFDLNNFLLTASTEKLYIYSSDLLNEMQVISSLKTIVFVKKKLLFLFKGNTKFLFRYKIALCVEKRWCCWSYLQ